MELLLTGKAIQQALQSESLHIFMYLMANDSPGNDSGEDIQGYHNNKHSLSSYYVSGTILRLHLCYVIELPK